MRQMLEKQRCTGCSACYNICPKDAISIKKDNNGFCYPVIEQEKCVNCGLCIKTCPVLNAKENKSINKCYAAYNKDDKEKEKASSGAIFTLVANYILDNHGIVIGAAFDENNKLKHTAIKEVKELGKLKGSKYLESDLTNIFKYIKENIKDNKILFVGTPCQVAGLKSVIKNNDNLITIDVVCHGVPSPKLFEKYIKELEGKNNDNLINYNFRDKSTGWDTYSNTATFKNSKKTELSKDNNYMNLFLSDVALRESCYDCNFKLGNKYSDITLGDFWGIKNKHPEMYSSKGVSAIIINTISGEKIFNEIKSNTIHKECDLMDIVDGNPSLVKSVHKPKQRDKFYAALDEYTIETLARKYKGKISIASKIKNKIKNVIKKSN